MFQIANKITEDKPLNVEEAKKLFEWLSFNIVNDYDTVNVTNQLTFPSEDSITGKKSESFNVTSPFIQPQTEKDEKHHGEREFMGDWEC